MTKLIVNSAMVRENNLSTIRKFFINNRYATKLEMANGTGLSVATCGTLLNELVKNGEVFKEGMKNSNGGRPAVRYEYDENFTLFCGIALIVDNGMEKIVSIVYNSFGEVVEKTSTVCKVITAEKILTEARKVVAAHKNVKLFGVGVPGIVDNTKIIDCDEKNLVGVDLAELLDKEFNVKTFVLNDSRTKLYGFYKTHEELAGKTLALISMPEDHCMGMGLIVDNELVRGENGVSGEIQYLPYYFSEREENLLEELAHIICSTIAIVNPAVMVITGTRLTEEMQKALINECAKHIPENFLPEMCYISDTTDIYVQGMIQRMLERWY